MRRNAFLPRGNELHFVYQHFSNVSLRAILRIVGARLQRPDKADFVSLDKVLVHKFSRLPPCYTVDEVRFASTLLVHVTTITRHGK